ncbi:MAG TPA: glycosyltransferase, partial [Pseudonocardiaceae bacterium]|nr:glycosyltransferase [Pseudonocardiaceae bacterium]
YCHNPARWLYGGAHLSSGAGPARQQMLVRPGFGLLRRIDRAAARAADVYVANSQTVKERIRRTYGIDAVVVPPPVNVERFRPLPRGNRLLVVSRLVPYKHVDVVVDTANHLGIGLDVIGDGPQLSALRAKAGPTVELHGALGDSAVVELMEGCRAVCVAAEEDFGMVSVEAQAAGKPVIAFGRGGSLETVRPGETGVFFSEHSIDSVSAAITAAENIDTPPGVIAAHARRFSRSAFRTRLSQLVRAAQDHGRMRGCGSGALDSAAMAGPTLAQWPAPRADPR